MPDNNETDRPTLNIVALDDDADFREYVEGVLTSDGHKPRTCASAAELFKLLEADTPDILLLDMNMGAESGEQVLQRIRERWDKLCVVIVTGYPSLETMRATFKKDVFDYLAKPFSIEDLRHVLDQAAVEFGLGARPQERLRVELGRQIRLARTRRQWTLKDLSELSGISVSQLSSIERGAHLPSVESLLSVAEALEAKPSTWLAAAGF